MGLKADVDLALSGEYDLVRIPHQRMSTRSGRKLAKRLRELGLRIQRLEAENARQRDVIAKLTVDFT